MPATVARSPLKTITAQVNSSLLNLTSSMFSLTASRDREQSFESPQWGGGHGIFTYYVIQGLQGEADTSGDGVVTADELAEYVHTNVRLATHMMQNPTSDRGSFDPGMVLAYNPGSSMTGELRSDASLWNLCHRDQHGRCGGLA